MDSFNLIIELLYLVGIREARKNEAQALVVFPAVLKILPQYIFNKKDPIVIGSTLAYYKYDSRNVSAMFFFFVLLL